MQEVMVFVKKNYFEVNVKSSFLYFLLSSRNMFRTINFTTLLLKPINNLLHRYMSEVKSPMPNVLTASRLDEEKKGQVELKV